MAKDRQIDGRLNIYWELELQGYNSYAIQEVKTPSLEFSEITYGQPYPLPDGKQPGKMKVGDMVVKKMRPLDSSEHADWDWIANTALQPAAARRVGFLKEKDANGKVLNTYFLGAVWPKKIGEKTYTLEGDGEVVMDEVTLACTYFINIESNAFKAMIRVF